MQWSDEVISRMCSKYVKPVSMAMDGHGLRGASGGCKGANLKKSINQTISQPINQSINHQIILWTTKTTD